MAHTQIIIWLSTLPLFQPGCSQEARIWTTARVLDHPSLDGFQPGLIRKGEMKPVAGLQRHPLIYSIFTWEMFPV